MLTEETKIESININEDNVLEIRMVTYIYRDGVLIAKTNEREVTSPGDDVSTKHDKIKTLASTLWTVDVINKWKAKPKPKDIKL